jgi:hypothetical protein
MQYRILVALLLAVVSFGAPTQAQPPQDVANSFSTMQIIVDAEPHTHAVWRAAIRSAFREAGFRRTPPVRFAGKRAATSPTFDVRRPLIFHLDCNGVQAGSKSKPRSPERPAFECSHTARAAELVALLISRQMLQTESNSHTPKPRRDTWPI